MTKSSGNSGQLPVYFASSEQTNRDEVAETLGHLRTRSGEGALERLIEEALSLGADAIIDYDFFQSGEDGWAFYARGTAIRTIDGPQYLSGERADQAGVTARQEQRYRSIRRRSRRRRVASLFGLGSGS